ncbi:MAG TPA: KpsF/GutQ family sugar-phosphate isomerase [Planctomycetaceae bacterium]|jgi:arabinose-5-phosphate isomerase|nr:KpsF/GutQ family sugar-phosphate isomerase [Planctomycetaceae bacterium]
MGSAAERTVIPFGEFELLREAREIIDDEARALFRVSAGLDEEFCKAVELLGACAGSIIVTGMGKAGLIGRKIVATLSSTGTRSHFLHPAEAVHGDLGCLANDDVLIVLSNSGETDEVCRILPSVGRFGVPVVAITASRTSTVGRSAAATIELGRLREAGPHSLAPSTTTTAMLAVGDALALVVGRRKGFTPQQFALYHTGGSLGAMLKSVGEIMRTGEQLRIAAETKSIRDVFAETSRPGRRTGAVILINAAGRLSGLFTDSDLAKLLEQRGDSLLDRPIAESMTRHPLTIGPEAMLSEAVEMLSHNRISELPVVDADGRPLGILDVTDVVGAGLDNGGPVARPLPLSPSRLEDSLSHPA